MLWIVVLAIVISVIWQLMRSRDSGVPVRTLSAEGRRRAFEVQAEAEAVALFARASAQGEAVQLARAIETARAAPPAVRKRRDPAAGAHRLAPGSRPALAAFAPLAALRAREPLGALPARVPRDPLAPLAGVRR